LDFEFFKVHIMSLNLRISNSDWDLFSQRRAKLGKSMFDFIHHRIEGSDLCVLDRTHRYLEPDLINLFGNFKLGVGIEPFVQNLRRYGATQEFVRWKLREFAGIGHAYGHYGPDLLVTTKNASNDRFAIPLLTIQIATPEFREDDLVYKTVFYETIGVQEYFIGEAEAERGTIIKAYRQVKGTRKWSYRYQEILPEENGFFSEVLNLKLPQHWSFNPA
jgi:hypothetical protein